MAADQAGRRAARKSGILGAQSTGKIKNQGKKSSREGMSRPPITPLTCQMLLQVQGQTAGTWASYLIHVVEGVCDGPPAGVVAPLEAPEGRAHCRGVRQRGHPGLVVPPLQAGRRRGHALVEIGRLRAACRQQSGAVESPDCHWPPAPLSQAISSGQVLVAV